AHRNASAHRNARSHELTIVSDASWRVAYGPLLEADLIMGESYDARLAFLGWDAAGFDASQWRPAVCFDDPGAVLVAMNGPAVRRHEVLTPAADPVKLPGWPLPRWIFDFGQNLVGRVRIRVHGEAGMTLTLRHGERLDAEGRLYTANLRTARQEDHYTLAGDGAEDYEPRFTFHGFRYVELSGYPGAPSRDMLTAVVLHSDIPQTGTFACSNPLIDQLQHNIVWGQKGNFVDIPTDCPQRDERLGWTGDAQVFIRTATFNRNVAAFFTKWQQDLADAQLATGAFPPVAPAIHTLETRDGGPAWADAAVICPWTLYLTYADRRLLAAHYETLVRFVDYLTGTSRDLIRSHPAVDPWGGFGDWLALDGSGRTEGGTPKDLIGTAMLAYVTRLMANIAGVLDKAKDAARFSALYEAVRAAFIARFVTPQGLLASQTQTACVLALYFDLVPGALRAQVVDTLVHDIRRRDLHLATGFVGTPYLLHVLTQAGHLDVAYALLNQTSWPSWLYPITQGATTIWERWDGWTPEKGFQTPDMNSFNHYAYGSVGDWLYAVVGGIDIDPGQPGYKHIVLRPRPGGDLAFAQATYDALYGRIESHWRVSEEALEWDVVIPPNTTATAYVPAHSGDTVLEGDTPAHFAEGITLLRREFAAAVYALGAGRYRFLVLPAS
ncbi:MAG: family 78 glycoside hydrolase catalytic domain, partial [Anaerolineae bacterium]|nr:family 78 glycoside hydrolase catalytic domain [Anaerolineae bacterium]